jgi:hypothetical protein
MPYQNFAEMPAHSRLWIYQSERALNETEIIFLKNQARDFVNQWTSHQNALKASAEFMQQHFLILAVDEQSAGASGCSIDKSVAFVKQLGQHLGLDFFDRWKFAFLADKNIQIADKEQFAILYQQQKINDNTLVFNNLITQKSQLENGWQIPLSQSWHAKFI